MAEQNDLPWHLALGKSISQFGVEFSGIPAIGLAVELLFEIIQLCHNVSVNRKAAKQLCLRCHRLLNGIKDVNTGSVDNAILDEAVQAVVNCLKAIRLKMIVWAELGWVESFLKQNDIKDDISQCHMVIDDCFKVFQFRIGIMSAEWHQDLAQNLRDDIRALQETVANADARKLASSANDQPSRWLMMSAVQQLNREASNKPESSDVAMGLSNTLFELSRELDQLLPDMNLLPSEIYRTSTMPVYFSQLIDVYEGVYLGRRPVAIKELRTVTDLQRTLKRFKREIEIWNDVWKVDKGTYIQSFYGYCVHEGTRPWMVSPWYRNGTAIDYVKSHDDDVHYLSLICGIVKGVGVLHNMVPTIAHGDLRGVNIMISDSGTPIIANFGLAKIIQDVSADVTHSKGLEDSYRWFAPELFGETPTVSPATDIYSLGMTILELLTHEHPYVGVKRNWDLPAKILGEEHPPRPTDDKPAGRGLTDDMWDLLTECWLADASRRPRITDVLSKLNK